MAWTVGFYTVFFPNLAPLSDEKAQEIVRTGLESSRVRMKNVLGVLVGIMGSGKSSFLNCIFNQPLPEVYTSTEITEPPVTGLLSPIGSMAFPMWELFTKSNLLEFLACTFREKSVTSARGVPRSSRRLSAPAATEPSWSPQFPSRSGIPSVAKQHLSPPVVPRMKQPQLNSTTSKSLVKLVKSPKSGCQSTNGALEVVRMIETGERTHFMGVILDQVHNSHLVILTLSLMHDLDEHPLTTNDNNKVDVHSPLLTSRQMVQRLVAALQARRFSRTKRASFRVMVVATHRDALPESQLTSRIKSFDSALRSILLPSCANELICTKERIPFILSLKKPDKSDFEALGLIREEITKLRLGNIVEEIRGSFLIFHQELLECSSQHPVEAIRASGILSLDTCLELGVRLGMGTNDIEAALLFLHQQKSLLYFPELIPQCIFMKPQFPFKVITEIAEFRRSVHNLVCFTPRLISSLEECVITEDILQSHLSHCFVPGLYWAQDAIKLMCHTQSLAQLTTDRVSDNKEYLMLSLSPLLPAKDAAQFVSPPSKLVAPLAVKFTNDCVPLGCFSYTIACLLSKYHWNLHRDEKGSPQCLTQNVVSFYDEIVQLQVVLVNAVTHLEIHLLQADRNHHLLSQACHEIHETVLLAVKHALSHAYLAQIEVSVGFLCHCQDPPHHLSVIHSFNPPHLQCSITKCDMGEVTEKHRIWPETSENKAPTLLKLYSYEVPEIVAADYTAKFGSILLNDDRGTRTAVIEHNYENHHNKYPLIVVNILREWLLGKGLEPVTWKTLTDTLQECRLHTLADKIKQGENIA